MAQILAEFIRNSIARAASTIAGGIPALDHEAIDDTMENQAIIKTLLNQIDEILRCNRCFILEEFNLESSFICLKNSFLLTESSCVAALMKLYVRLVEQKG